MSKPRTISDYPNRADDYEEAVSKMHDQNTDSALDEGGDNEVSAEQLRTHIDSTENPHNVTAGQVGAYTKGETDDLLDDKADQSDLNATNQAVGELDDRVGTAEGGIQGLSDGLDDTNQALGALDNEALKKFTYGIREQFNTLGSGATRYVILLCRTDLTGSVNGDFFGWDDSQSTRSDMLGQIVFRRADGSPSYVDLQFDLAITHTWANIEAIQCDYEGERWYAIQVTGLSGNRWHRYTAFDGFQTGDADVQTVSIGDVSNISSVTLRNGERRIHGNISQTGNFRTDGTVTASDFITSSRVESNTENALSALDNIAEWKKKDGTIDYKKHYAYTPQVVRDEKGKVIEEKPGLSMEKRVAMLEKMVAELSDQLKNEKTQRK